MIVEIIGTMMKTVKSLFGKQKAFKADNMSALEILTKEKAVLNE